MSCRLAFPRPIVFDSDYWLCRCQGFRVDSPVGRVGVVAEVRFGSRIDRPDTLVVRTGVLGNRLLVVPVTEVAQVAPAEQRLVIDTAPLRSRGHPRVARLRQRLGALGARPPLR